MILLTGATGLVGAHLLYFLLNEQQKVRAIYRKTSNLQEVKKVLSYYADEAETYFNKVEWVEADLTDLPALTNAFNNITHVYHAAAYVSFNPKDYHKLRKSNTEGTANIVNLCLHFEVKKLCFVSSIATLGKSTSKPIHEEMHWNPDDDNNVYALSKYGSEMEVWRGTQEGLEAVIVNPGVILGSGFWHKGTGALFSKSYKGLRFYTQGKMGFVDVVDVAKIMIALMQSPIKNERYILVSQSVTYQELFTQMAAAFGKKPPHIALKPWMLRLAVWGNAFWSFVSQTKPTLFKSTTRAILRKQTYTNQKVVKALDYRFKPLSQTINEVAQNYLADMQR